jgi:hypothetical protein
MWIIKSEVVQYADGKRVELADGGHRASTISVKYGKRNRHFMHNYLYQ